MEDARDRAEYAWRRLVRHAETGGIDPADRAEGIAVLQQALPTLRADPRTTREELALLLFMLADALGEKYDEHPVRDDLDLSIACTAEGVGLVVHDHTTWVEQLACLGIRHAARYIDHQTEDDFAPAVSALGTASGRGEWDEAGARNLHLWLTRITDIRHLRIGGADSLDATVRTLAEEWNRWPDPVLGLLYARRLMQRDATGDARTALRVAQGLLAGTLQLSGEQRGSADRLAMAASWALYRTSEGAKPVEAAEYQLAACHALAVIGNPAATVADRTAARINRGVITVRYVEVKLHFPDDTGVVAADLEELYQTVDEQRRPLVGALLAIVASASVAVDTDGAGAMRQIALIDEVLRHGNAVVAWRVQLLLTLGNMLIIKVEAGSGGLADLDRADAVFRQILVEYPAQHVVASGGLGMVLATRAAYGYGRQSDLNDAIEVLTVAVESPSTPADFRAALIPGFVTALMRRFLMTGGIADLRRGLDLMENVRTYAQTSSLRNVGFDVLYALILLRWREATGSGSLPEIITMLEACLERTPVGNGNRGRTLQGLAHAWLQRAYDIRKNAPLGPALRYAVMLVDECDPAGDLAAINVLVASGVIFTAGLVTSDVDLLRQAATLYRKKLGDRHAGNPVLPQILMVEGLSRLQIFNLTGDRTELQQATEALQRAYDDSPELSLGAVEKAIALGWAYEAQGDLRKARDMGDVAIRTSTYHVLTQSSTREAMAAVRLGATYALSTARWCLRDGDPLAAWRAVETGRGLVLHAATVTATVPELLEQVGHADLAAAWRAATRDTSFDARPDADDWRRGTPELPSGIRQRALSALLDDPVLFEPPSADAVRQALHTVDADALVYLFPGDNKHAGLALFFDVQGKIETLDLPGLTDQWTTPAGVVRLGALRSAHSRGRDLEPGEAGPAREGLQQLCRAAWDAVMGPVLDRWRGREPRLILIPAGALAMVPWHAAYGEGEHGRRWAIDEAEISYIASARLLVEVAHRQRQPAGRRAVVIGNPDTGNVRDDLAGAGDEAVTIHSRFYPDGPFLGRPVGRATGPGTPQDVLRWLTGRLDPHPPVLHLACHGIVRADGPTTSSLQLAGGAMLSAEEILHAAARRPTGLSAGLVTLAACTTHLAGRSYDEAVTLSTAFLVAGASTAIGSLWRVPDEETAQLMVAFHENLAVHDMPARAALRAAQRWLRDGGDGPSEESLRSWAGFAHLGV